MRRVAATVSRPDTARKSKNRLPSPRAYPSAQRHQCNHPRFAHVDSMVVRKSSPEAFDTRRTCTSITDTHTRAAIPYIRGTLKTL